MKLFEMVTLFEFLAFRFGLTAVYLVLIQYFTKIGGKISMKLIQRENNENTENEADSLVYKVMSRLVQAFDFFFLLFVEMLMKYLLYVAGFWPLLYAVIYRNFLSCPSPSQLQDPSAGFNSASNSISGI